MRERSASMTSRHSIATEAGARDYVSSEQVFLETFSVEVSLAGIEPVGFRVKNDLRSHCAIVQPRFENLLA